MRTEALLYALKLTRQIIIAQNFSSPQNEQKVKRVHAKVMGKLLERGEFEGLRRLGLEANSGFAACPDFKPKVVDRLPGNRSVVGLVREQEGNDYYPVKRELVGRKYVTRCNGGVVCEEFYKATGEEDRQLLKLTRKHRGLSGPEGVMLRTVPIEQARRLLFTSCGANGKPKG